MKILFCSLLVLVSANFAFAQKTFEVQDFSKDYYGKVYIEKPSEVFSRGWVAIYDRKTNRQLFRVVSDALTSDTEGGKIKANVKELPYGEQSAIIYDDFNFDGIKDFAIMDGQNSCYGGPSFQIYLAGKLKGKFTLNKAFTRLAQDYCGMFETDAKTKKITTMTKSGCCWHEFSEFIVINNTPQAIKIVEEDLANSPFQKVTTGVWDGKKMVKSTSRVINFEEDNVTILFSFLTTDGNQVILFVNEGALNYIFINKSGNISFAYPQDSGQENAGFTLDSKENPAALTFTNKTATYKIYETGNAQIGVEVSENGKRSNIAGDISSKKGNLKKVSEEELSNVTFK